MKQKKKQSQAGASQLNKMEGRPKSALLNILAAPLSGALISLGHAPYNLWFVALVALVPLLWSLKGATRGGAALRGYLFGSALFASLFWWFTTVSRFGYPAGIGYALLCVLPPVMFIPWAMAAARLLDRGDALSILTCAGAWVVFEWIITQGIFGFPWWQLGNTQISNLLLAQSASLGGVCFLSFVVMLFNLFVFSASTKQLAANKALWACSAAAALGIVVYGAAALSSSRSDSAAKDGWQKISILQPNIPQEQKEIFGSSYQSIYSEHMRMSADAVIKSKPDILFWPETATFLKWLAGPEVLPATVNMLKAFNTMMVAGVYEDAEEGPYNSVVAIEPESGLLGVYRKIRIVPFGEAFPFRKQFEAISPALGRLIDEMVYETDMLSGTDYKVFESKRGKFGAMICFESIFPSVSRKMALGGAEYLFVVTNDGWFFKTPGVYQHAAMGALRAIETRRYVVQAANSGLSFVADPNGRMAVSGPVMEKTIVEGRIRPRTDITIYTRFGDWICLIGAALCAASIARGIAARKKKD